MVHDQDLMTPTMRTPLSVGPSGVRRWVDFAADVDLLRPRLKGAGGVCNLLSDRYDFMVGMAAALAEGCTIVLPPSRAPAALAQAIESVSECLLLGSADGAPDHLAQMGNIESSAHPIDPNFLWRRIVCSDSDVRVFTSGSTGRPVLHKKTLNILLSGSHLTEQLLRRSGLGVEPFVLIGTTPQQHMYGLEATCCAGLGFGNIVWRGPVFYPEDLSQAAEEIRRQGFKAAALITSPAHLKFLEPVIVETPEIRTVISATAPLSEEMAVRLEGERARKVFEIYGSTETGSMAWRRTRTGPEWTLLDGFSLSEDEQGWRASAPQLAEAPRLGDMIERRDGGKFVLLGRNNDLVVIAGCRASLAALNLALNDINGLVDGVFLKQSGAGSDTLSIAAVRHHACAQSNDVLRRSIRRQLSDQIDPIFIPRRIFFVEKLPRNDVGKLREDALLELQASLLDTD